MNREQLLVLLRERYKQNGNARDLWNCCERGDWMLWIAVKLEVDKKHLVKAACECATIALHLIPEGEERPRKAIETALAWTEGNASLEDVHRASAASAAYADDAIDIVYAVSAAYAASAAAYDFCTSYAPFAACAAADACARHAGNTARIRDAKDTRDVARCRVLGQCAEIVREVIPWELVDVQLLGWLMINC
jgi:hypothetical protein